MWDLGSCHHHLARARSCWGQAWTGPPIPSGTCLLAARPLKGEVVASLVLVNVANVRSGEEAAVPVVLMSETLLLRREWLLARRCLGRPGALKAAAAEADVISPAAAEVEELMTWAAAGLMMREGEELGRLAPTGLICWRTVFER